MGCSFRIRHEDNFCKTSKNVINNHFSAFFFYIFHRRIFVELSLWHVFEALNYNLIEWTTSIIKSWLTTLSVPQLYRLLFFPFILVFLIYINKMME